MGFCKFLFLLSSLWSFCSSVSSQLQASHVQVLLQLKKHLEYPKQLESWYDRKTNFCYLPSTPQMNITCLSNTVSELNIIGDKSSDKADSFEGSAIPDVTLSDGFSIDSFFTTLSRLKDLRVLTLSSLGIWGPLPEKLHRLSSLEHLDLSDNFLFGSVPPKLSTMVKLEAFILDNNFFNGTFPTWFPSLPDLRALGLKNNGLVGQIPSSLLSSPSMEYLNLASNLLSGSLPGNLSCGSKLGFVDISDNKLTGELPPCLSKKPSETLVLKFGGNCLSVDKRQQHPSSYCIEEVQVKEPRAAVTERSGGKGKGALVGLLVGISMAVLVLVFGLLVLVRRYCRSGITEKHLLHKTIQDNPATGFSSEILANARYISEASKFGSHDLPACRQFSLEEIRIATNDFDKAAIMGEGSYGTLYKGHLENGMKVAIRCLPSSKKYSIRNLKLRLDLLAKLRHPNLVCLLGHCIDSGGRDDYSVEKVFMIYEYVPNGNFRSCLSENSSGKAMSWSERLNVLTGVAKAVHFLHTGVIPGFFSNRLKANNVLLNQHRFAKLSDYGLSIVSEATRHNTTVKQSSWQMSRLEDDVYSFGLILLESIVGPSVSAREEAFLRDELAWLESEEGRRKMVNQTVQATCSQESLKRVISIMTKCVSPESLSRPSFEDILWNLQYASQLQSSEGLSSNAF
ncbi:PREDICTED: probable inactive leucine-rich repeat receptor-like protein kinase At3g03770 [Tarenaya hassleriana]|uniref:probable inactive leucine-rich repeat receptor-like protein kinase At3g03770 n=1 Tax=Tarenaya hassleriana TaxID=28532 RepID=UPI00053C3D87|nr:PREDICTED: probable inactive leucine-rich repeat receptor-like protein kinase At3g03770 [Tarenaya hassleriana]